MAQLARSHAPRGEFDSNFWRERGLGEKPSTREKFVALTIDELAKTGPHSFNATLICDLLGTTYPMVNHYFGNRDGLIAEAAAVAYRQYVFGMRDAVLAEPGDARARLAAWIRQQMAWTAEHPGIAVMLDFPHASLEISALLTEAHQAEMAELFEFNMANLMQLVRGVRTNTVLPLDFEPGALPRAELMGDLELVKLASSISLSTLGPALFMAGRPLQSRTTTEIDEFTGVVLDQHIANLVALAAGELP